MKTDRVEKVLEVVVFILYAAAVSWLAVAFFIK